jgi:hypothetical protein
VSMSARCSAFVVFLAAGLNILYNLYEWYILYNRTTGALS